MIRSKTCFKCKAVKPLDQFYKHSRMADGHVNKCKECNKLDVRQNRAKNIDYYREFDRVRAKNPERVKAASEINKAWRDADKRRAKCHRAVSFAIKSGKLIRKNCVRCGDAKSVAHHEDYDKPLDVIWLCQPCHKQRHKEILLGKNGEGYEHNSI